MFDIFIHSHTQRIMVYACLTQPHTQCIMLFLPGGQRTGNHSALLLPYWKIRLDSTPSYIIMALC